MFKQDLLVAVGVSIIFLFINFRFSIGIMAGYLFSILNYKIIEYRYNNVEIVSFLIVFGALISTFVLVVPLIVSFLIPNIMNYIGVIIGLMINRTRIIIEAFLNK